MRKTCFLFNGRQDEEHLQAYGGQQGLQEQEDCVAEDELDEITDSQVAPETQEVFVQLFKKSQKVCWCSSPSPAPDLK